MVPTTHMSLLEKRDIDQEQANHWNGNNTTVVPAAASTETHVVPVAASTETHVVPVAASTETTHIVPAAALTETPVVSAAASTKLNPVTALHTPEPEPTAPSDSSDKQWEYNDVQAISKFPRKVTHILFPALLTEWHRKHAGILRQPEYKYISKEWEIMVQKIDNTSTQYFNFMTLLNPNFNNFKNIKYKDGKIYLTLATRTLYKQNLLDLFTSWTPVGPKCPTAASLAETEKDTTAIIVKISPRIESMSETYINALISMKIESMQDLQKTNTTQIDSMLATINQMMYNHRTQSTQIGQLTETTKEQARHIDTLNQIIGDQERQLATLNSEMKSFEGYK